MKILPYFVSCIAAVFLEFYCYFKAFNLEETDPLKDVWRSLLLLALAVGMVVFSSDIKKGEEKK